MRLLFCLFVLLATSIFGQNLTSTITSTSGDYTLTCLKTTLTLTVSASTTNSYQSTWHTTQNTSIIGNSITISNPDTYTIVTKDLVSNDSVSNILIIYQDTVKPKVKRDTIYFHCSAVPGSQLDYTTSISVKFLSPCPNCTFNWLNNFGGIATPTNVATVIVVYLGSYTCNVTNTVNGCSSIFIMDVLCNVGLNEYKYSTNLISFFPNPVNDKLNYNKAIDVPIDRIEITNLLGLNAIEFNNHELKGELNLSSLKPGIYILNLFSNKQKLKYKIIKQ